MAPPDGMIASARILGLFDGGEPPSALVESCESLGLDLIPYVECMPFGPTPRLLVGAVSPWRLSMGLSADFSGFVEMAPGTTRSDPQAWQECVAAAASGGIGVSLTAGSAYAHDVPPPLVAAIGRRFPDATCVPAIELALYEALANAIIHGNLGIGSALRASAAGLREYRASLAAALADPAKAGRRVTVTCAPHGDCLRLVVRDQGAGWETGALAAPAADADAKSGRGLDLIRQVSLRVTAEDGGRRLIMDFLRRAP